MAPPQVQDYVIVHELMHLVEPNHSKKFWSLVKEACPSYKEHRAWLRENGQRLSLRCEGFTGGGQHHALGQYAQVKYGPGGEGSVQAAF